MCVVHNQKDMYIHIKDWCKRYQDKWDEDSSIFDRLLKLPNKDKQTPLLFAARLVSERGEGVGGAGVCAVAGRQLLLCMSV